MLNEPAPSGARSVFVVARGYHTGLAVRSSDVPPGSLPLPDDLRTADFIELGWGARDYYPVDDPGILQAVRVLLTPSASTIEVDPRASPLARSLSGSEVVELRVSGDDFSRLLAFLRRSYTLDREGRPIPVPAGALQQGRFYESPRTFHMFENCNVWTARALESAGIPINPATTLTAARLLRQVRDMNERGGLADAPAHVAQ